MHRTVFMAYRALPCPGDFTCAFVLMIPQDLFKGGSTYSRITYRSVVDRNSVVGTLL